MRHSRWIIPPIILAAGVASLVSSIIWSIVAGVPIPEQDPSPATIAYAEFHYRIVLVLMNTGVLFGATAMLWAAVLLVQRKKRAGSQ